MIGFNAPSTRMGGPETSDVLSPEQSLRSLSESAVNLEEQVVASCLRNILAAQSTSVFANQQSSNMLSGNTNGSYSALAQTTQLLQSFMNLMLMRMLQSLFSQALGGQSDTGSDNASSGLQLPHFVTRNIAQAQSGSQSTQQPAEQPSTTADGSAGTDPATQKQLAQVVTVFARHQDILKQRGALHADSLATLADDPTVPDDLRQAAQTVIANPALFNSLDAGKTGKTDGKFSYKDINSLSHNSSIMQYANQEAETYTKNYIPSNAAPGTQARAITRNDAINELYTYSESLPKHIDLNTLQAIANGSQSMDKSSPQVIAAAKYFVDNPSQWTAFTGGRARISRNKLCDLAAQQISLTDSQKNTLATLQQHSDQVFANGPLSREKLASLAADTSVDPSVQQAAQNLLNDPELFSMLDNAQTHAGGSAWKKSNDDKITKKDLNRFLSDQVKSTGAQTSSTAAPTDSASGEATEDDLSAQMDMVYGQEVTPDAKKSRGGEAKKALEITAEVASIATAFIPSPLGAIGLVGNMARLGGMAAARGVATASSREVAREIAKETGKEIAKEGVNQVVSNEIQNKRSQIASRNSAPVQQAYYTAS